MAEIKIYATPPNLYRYRALGANLLRELEAIDGAYIYCPHFNQLNDPMEGTHRISLRFLANATSQRVRTEVQRAQEAMGIASLSEVFDHEPMWAHYADQFRGICIQYNTRQLLRGLPSDVDIARMQYSESPPVILEEKQSPSDRAKMALSSKTIRWASEREWRALSPVAGRAQYGDVSTVKRIYLGARIAPPDEERVRSLTPTRNGKLACVREMQTTSSAASATESSGISPGPASMGYVASYFSIHTAWKWHGRQ